MKVGGESGVLLVWIASDADGAGGCLRPRRRAQQPSPETGQRNDAETSATTSPSGPGSPTTSDGASADDEAAEPEESQEPESGAETEETRPPPRPVPVLGLAEQRHRGDRLLGAVRERTAGYTSYDVTYRSRSTTPRGEESYTISGVLNVPTGRGRFPAVVLAHGYIDPAYDDARARLPRGPRVRRPARRLLQPRRVRRRPALPDPDAAVQGWSQAASPAAMSSSRCSARKRTCLPIRVHRRRRPGCRPWTTLGPIARDIHRKAGSTQAPAQCVGDRLLVLDHQHPRHISLVSSDLGDSPGHTSTYRFGQPSVRRLSALSATLSPG